LPDLAGNNHVDNRTGPLPAGFALPFSAKAAQAAKLWACGSTAACSRRIRLIKPHGSKDWAATARNSAVARSSIY